MVVIVAVVGLLLEYIAGVVSAFIVSTFFFILGTVISQEFGLLTFVLVFLFSLPVSPLIGICLVDKIFFRIPKFEGKAIVAGVVTGFLGIPACIFVAALIVNSLPLARGYKVGEFWYFLLAVLFPFLGYNFFRVRVLVTHSIMEKAKVKEQTESILPPGKETTGRINYLVLIASAWVIIAMLSYAFLYFTEWDEERFEATVLLCGLSGSLALIFGVIALLFTLTSKRKVTGVSYAAIVILLSLFPLLGSVIRWRDHRAHLHRQQTQSISYNLRLLHNVLMKYAEDHDGHLPISDRWCDLLLKHNQSLTSENLKHPLADILDLTGQCHVAFNKNLSGLRLSEIPEDVVLLFEADGDWNLTGTSESFKKRLSYGGVASVLFTDGSIKSYLYTNGTIIMAISPEKSIQRELRWEP